ncbi:MULTISPECIES: SMP-30/gluconolactonase/LRE family protein [unclassified Rathayibacter]|uniref:SMP-30/gluconolactonase/LRE family protein n=1 Tax=unclassified Rathayibacter TaxID=2609250 RepID=UPI00188A74A2|nr:MULTISPECIES: SMP-30/gluconolactonase/LRE family protein [unclassified Rathayibacter]MBF4463075.1 SMP-30/gluconolactonase/LRE family protein [Rathayibacter sp. VKM Ac-2879]MBF4504688.1 SMP-30/gluconolactonase/LRE family protein [Rathayibacter sp. VKM Ac-2878]
MIDATPAGTPRYLLGEGPVWDGMTGLLTWVDIEAGAVLSAPLGSGAEPTLGTIARTEVGEQLGCAFPLGDGRMLLALTRTLAILERDGSLTRGSELLPEGHRFNDGTIDPHGRLIVGSLTLGEPLGDDLLLRVEHDGGVTVLDHDLSLSNGLGFSPDGTVLYSCDTESGVIYRRPALDGGDGAREPFVELDEGVFADGLTVDAQGRVWVAIWGGGAVRVYDAEGRLLEGEGLRIAAPHATSIAFAGDALDVAVVTSASRDLSEEELAATPSAGGLWLARPGARGLPATRWVETRLP